MIHQFWRLSEDGENNLGLACTADGLLLGHTPLVERRGGHFEVRERAEIESLLSSVFKKQISTDRLMSGLATVASALNADDRCLACIAAVHLRIPDLPNKVARDKLQAADILIKSTNCNHAQHVEDILKASPGDPKHPGWPAGTDGGRGGKFRPKDESEIVEAVENRVWRIAVRRLLRMGALAALRMTVEAAEGLLPIIGVAGDIAVLVDLANTISEFRKLKIDADAAIDFVKRGRHNFEDLQVTSSGYKEFSSYDQFYKGEINLCKIDKRFGAAGAGNQYHHIVTQGGENALKIPAE